MTVMVHGKQGFAGRIQRDMQALLEWAARDSDRTMLYGAELKIAVP
jgi:hypothetical protein